MFIYSLKHVCTKMELVISTYNKYKDEFKPLIKAQNIYYYLPTDQSTPK